jgi:hypothetical protein
VSVQRKCGLLLLAGALAAVTLRLVGAPEWLVTLALLGPFSVAAVMWPRPKRCAFCWRIADGAFWHGRLRIPHCDRHAHDAMRAAR